MESKPKNELIRIVSGPEGDLLQDLTGKAEGRGVYLCKDKVCIDQAHKKRALARSLKRSITEEQVNKLFQELDYEERKDT